MKSSGCKSLPLRLKDSADRRWIGNDESKRNHNGVIPLADSPLTLALSWRAGKGKPAVVVAVMELDLERLLAEGFIRSEKRDSVRVRFYHDSDGHVYLQTRLGEPRIRVDTK
jgi:hypothetical protein